MVSKKEMFEAIKVDYPQMPNEMIETVLELNEKDSKFIEDVIKAERKKYKTIPKVKRQMDINDLDVLTSIFKEKEKDILKNNAATIVKAEENLVEVVEV